VTKDLTKYSSVDRWLNRVFADGVRSRSTQNLYLYFLGRFCQFTKKDPDQLIAERREHLKSSDELIKRQHEDLLTKWRLHLEETGLARSSASTAHNVIKSFYHNNYYPLEVKAPTSWPATKRKVPTPKELATMVDIASNSQDKAIIVCLAQSGISLGDFLGITYDMVKEQIEQGVEPIHLPMIRSKVKKEYDTFFGRDSIEYLKLYLKDYGFKPSDPLFPVSKRTVEYVVKNASIRAGLKPHVTPHRLRAYFNTFMSLSFHTAQSEHIPLVEYWMGHTLPYGGTYMVPPVDKHCDCKSPCTLHPYQRQLYKDHELAISLPGKEF